MALEQVDPAVLKRDVLHLVLHHPDGVTFGDFAGAFHQLNGYHPQLALHGYRSLKDLVTDMKDVVVLEGDSQNPVIKIANDLELYQWLEEGDEYGWDCTGWADSGEDSQSLLYEEEETEEVSEVLELITSLLSTYKTGLRIEKLQKYLLDKNGVDLEKFSISYGYKDSLEFLEHQMTELMIRYRENRQKCVVQLTADAAGEAQPPVSSSYCNKVLPTGLTISSSCPAPLQDVPLDSSKTAQNPEQSIDKDRTQNGLVPPSTNHIVSQVKALLSTYDSGLRLEKLQEFLLARNGVDLEKFSIAHGYSEALAFLKQQIPELTIQYSGKRQKCVVQLTGNIAGEMQPPASNSSCKKVLQTGLTISPGCPALLQEVPLDSSEKAQNPEESKDKNRTQNGTEPSLSTNPIVSQVKALLSNYKLGLKIKKLQEFLLTKEGVDLKKFCITQGYKDILKFLKHQIPELVIQYKGNRLNCVVQLIADTTGQMQPPVASSSCEKVLQTGLTISSSCSTTQDLPLDSSKTAQNSDPRREKNRLGIEPPPCSNYAVSQLPVQTAMEEGDSVALKRDVLRLVLQNPEGVTFGNFSGAFQQLHGYHPQLSLYGYSSLRNLLSEMKEIVIVDGDSQNPVIKIANDLELYQCLEGDEYGWDYAGMDDSEEESQNLLYEETETEEVSEVLELITSLLSSYKTGLRIEKLQEFLLARNGVDLEKFSIAHGYKDTLEFLEHQMLELTITYRENRQKCVVQLTASAAGEMQLAVSSSSCEKVLQTMSSRCPSPPQNLPLDTSEKALNPEHGTEKNNIQNRTIPPLSTNHVVPQLQGQMVLQKGDPGALKRNVLHLVLQHPEGVSFGGFPKAFQQLHGYCPQLTSHGYSSLWDLVDDMNDTVLLEGDFQNPLIKIASESNLYQWLRGGEESEWNDSEKKSQSWSYEEGAKEDAGFSVAFVAVRDILKNHPKGLKVNKLKEAIRDKCDFDLERIRCHLGYKDIVSFLQDMPGLHLRNSNRVRNCVVQLQPGPSSPAPSLDTDFSACDSNAPFQEPVRKESGTHSPTPSLDTDFCAHDSNAVPERVMTKQPDLTAALVLVLDVLGDYPLGLNLKALKENLETKHRFDLDTFSQDLGYEDVMVCLLDTPGLCITYQNGRKPQNSLIQLLSGVSVLPSWLLSVGHSLDKPLSLHKKPMESKPDSCISTSTQVSAPLLLSLDSKETSTKSETSNQMKVEMKPALEDVLALLSKLLSAKGYKAGLRLKKVQKKLAGKGVNLEKFSIAQGHKDSLAFLECHMPELKITYHENQLSSVLKLPSGSGVNSAPPLLGGPAPCIEATNSMPVSHSSTASQFNASAAFNLEGSANQSKIRLGNKPAVEKVVARVYSILKRHPVGLKLKKLQEMLMTKPGVNLEEFSIAHGHKDSLAFLECRIPELKFRNQKTRINPVLKLKSGHPVSRSSTSSQVSAAQSLNSNQSSIVSETLNQMKIDKKPAALEEVLSALSSLLKLPYYKSGLRLMKVQEFLLTKEGIDLEKFSIAQGHKDSLAFLECHMPQLMIRNQEDRLNCVLQHKSGHEINSIPPSHYAPANLARPGIPILRPSWIGGNSSPQQTDTIPHSTNAGEVAFLPPLHDAPIPLRKTLRIVKSANILPGFEDVVEPLPTFHDYSANRFWIQNLSDPSAAIQNPPVSQNPYGAFSDNCSSQPHADISDQLSDKHQLRRPPPVEDIPSFSNAQLLRRPNLNGPHHLKDLDELKQEVAHILARHPEGISLFQFRVEYSAAYQKNLQLGNASSAKQFLLQMPDVVCLKGYGVQTLLFPVSSKELALKSGHQIISRVEDATVVPSHSFSKAVIVADPVVGFQPSPPRAPPRATVKPQPCTIHPLASGHLGEPGKTGGSILPQSEMQSAPKPRSLLQEHGVARAKLGDPSGHSHLSKVAEAAMAPACSLSKTDPMVVSKSSVPKATVAPVPQPRSFPHLYSECFYPPSNKKSPQPNTSPQKAPKAANPEEDQVMASARTRQTPVLPSSPVVFSSEWGESPVGFASKSTHLPTSKTFNQCTLPFLSQPLPSSFMPWTQPLLFSPTMFLTQHAPPSCPANVYNTSSPQPQNVKPPNSHLVQSVPQMRPVQPTSPLQSTEQRSYVYSAQGHGFSSQELTSSRMVIHAPHQSPAFSVDRLPTSLPFQSQPSTYASRSQTIYQTEYYRHPWLDDTQCRSMQSTVSAVDNSITTTTSATAPSQSMAYLSQSVHLNKTVTSRTPPTHLPPTQTDNVSQQLSYVSRHVSAHTLPSSDPGALPQTLSISNRDPQALKYPQQYVEVRSTTSTIATQTASTVTSPVYFPTDTSGQPSYMSSNPTRYAVPNQTKSFLATSKTEEQDNHYLPSADKQTPHLTQRPTDSYSSGFQDKPPKSPGKCVIL